jgi:hypothetical protein
MKWLIKTKTTDIEHFRRLPDCHTAWSRILSVVLILYTFKQKNQDAFGTLELLSYD